MGYQVKGRLVMSVGDLSTIMSELGPRIVLYTLLRYSSNEFVYTSMYIRTSLCESTIPGSCTIQCRKIRRSEKKTQAFVCVPQ